MDQSSDLPASLRSRPAGYSVIAECLRLQELAPERSALARVFGVRPIGPEVAPWFSGAIGELHVGTLLARLGPAYTVLHAVPVGTGSSDIDHIVVGPAGVVTINTKRHAGKSVWVSPKVLMVSGQKQDHLRNARHEAKRTRGILSAATGRDIPVHPLIVVVEAKSLTVRQEPGDVSVVSDGRLLRWLKRRPAVLSEAEVVELSALVDNSRLWHRTAETAVDARQRERFDRLREEESRAYRRRVGWGAVLAVGAAFGFYTVATLALPALLGLLG